MPSASGWPWLRDPLAISEHPCVLPSREAAAGRLIPDARCGSSAASGWAHDIGYGGLDHVLALDHDVNILVLDTEVFQHRRPDTSKATPLGAVASLGRVQGHRQEGPGWPGAVDYGHVYVATVAYGAGRDVHTPRRFHEAEAHPGPSLIIAYSPRIAHGVTCSTTSASRSWR